jgi:predicted RNase H-like HicB family nuclease
MIFRALSMKGRRAEGLGDGIGVLGSRLPGCFSASDTLDDALSNTEEAAAAWIYSALDDGYAIPAPSSLDTLREDPQFAGWSFGFVKVPDHVLAAAITDASRAGLNGWRQSKSSAAADLEFWRHWPPQSHAAIPNRSADASAHTRPQRGSSMLPSSAPFGRRG